MKIYTGMNKNIVIFDNVKDGDVFEAQGFYFMKIPEVYTTNGYVNAVRLDSGWVVCFKGVDSVRYIDAELVV